MSVHYVETLDELRKLLESVVTCTSYDENQEDFIFVYDSWFDRLVMQRVDQCTADSVRAYRYLKNIVTKISSIFGHVPPAVGIHSSKMQAAFYMDHDQIDPTIVLSIEELTQHPVGAIWTALHEYMHYVQRKVCGYLEPLRGNIFYRECRWKGSTIRVDLMETPHHMLPWEAEADSFANANIGFFLNEFGYAPAQFENPLPSSDPENVKIRVQPNFNVERKQPEFWYYNSENSGCL